MENSNGTPVGTTRTAPVREGHQHHEGENSGNSGNINRAEVHDRTGLYLAVIAILFSAMAFGMAIVLPMIYQERTQNLADRVQTAERNTALAREDVRIMQQALAARGIQTDEHAEEKGK